MTERVSDELFPWSMKQVEGALRSSIHDHGEITKNTAGSAAKRVVNQLYGATAPTQATSRLEAAHKRELRLLNRVHDLVHILDQVEQRLDYWYDHGLPARSQSAWTTLHVVRAALSLSKEEQKSGCWR